MFYTDLEYGLGKERVTRVREEVGRNRLEARLAREARVSAGAADRERGVLARGATLAAGLFGLGWR